MKYSLAFLALLTALPAGAALADTRCSTPMKDWRPREAVQQLAQQNGWTVRRITIDDGCYEIDGVAADGRRVEAKVDPATLELLKTEYKRDRRRHDRMGGGHD